VGSFAVILATLAFRHEVPLVGIGLVVVVPAIAFGQLRTILSVNGEKERRESRSNAAQQRRWPRWSSGFSTDDLFGGLTRRQRRLVYGLAAFGWIAALPGMVLAPTPRTTPNSCEATLNDHGKTRCVDPDDLDRYQAGVQRFGAGIVLCFCVIHAAAAHSDIRQRGQVNGEDQQAAQTGT
jgi:hypothetical protein